MFINKAIIGINNGLNSLILPAHQAQDPKEIPTPAEVLNVAMLASTAAIVIFSVLGVSGAIPLSSGSVSNFSVISGATFVGVASLGLIPRAVAAVKKLLTRKKRLHPRENPESRALELRMPGTVSRFVYPRGYLKEGFGFMTRGVIRVLQHLHNVKAPAGEPMPPPPYPFKKMS